MSAAAPTEKYAFRMFLNPGCVAIEGGRGSIVGTMLAVLLLGLFTFAMGMANVTGIVMSMVIGVLLIVSMVLPRLFKRQGVRA